MIKENHLQVLRAANSPWVDRVRRRKRGRRSAPIQMEIQSERDLKDALKIKPPRVLLDNLPPKTLKRMMRVLRRQVPGIEIEFTGGIKPDHLRALARLHPDRISMGRLTHSVQAFDCSLDITHVYTH